MPYIEKDRRNVLDPLIADLVKELKKAPTQNLDGELNYVITKLLKSNYELRYYALNRAMGLLECAKQEFYRTVVGPYEEEKRKERGDIEACFHSSNFWMKFQKQIYR